MQLVKHYKDILKLVLWKTETAMCWFLSDRWCLNYQYARRHGRFIDWKNPTTFNEKIQWLKLNYQDPLFKQLCDKVDVRAYVENKAGSSILIPSIAVFHSAEAIDWASLPSRFVLKASHGSGWNIICKNKKELDLDKCARLTRKWMASDFYRYQREWAYKDVKPKLICEAYLSDSRGEPPADYKFFCFDGAVKMIQVDSDRFVGHHRALFDGSWNRLPFGLKFPPSREEIVKPDNLSDLISVAEKLSAGIPFVRVDLYSLQGKVYFGEMTLYPGGGLEHFYPGKYDAELGSYLNLPIRNVAE